MKRNVTEGIIDVLCYGDGSVRVYDHDNIDPRCGNPDLITKLDDVLERLRSPHKKEPFAIPVTIYKELVGPNWVFDV